jgi:hypothetical protein
MLRILVFALTLILSPLPISAAEPASGALMREAGLESLFRDFGNTVTPSPRQSGVTDERFLSAWEKAATGAFGSKALTDQLQQRLAETLSDAEITEIVAFMTSPLAKRLGQLERVPPEKQIESLAKGKTIYLSLTETRRVRLDEVMHLSGADTTFATIRQALRAVALGLRLSAQGDIALSWEEIDRETQAKLAGMEDSLTDAMRSALAFSFAEVSDAELETYLEFLRAPATRKFYAAATAAIGQIIEETMFDLGRDVAARLSAVSI